MSVPLRKMQNSVAQSENSANICLDKRLEAEIRIVVREEIRDFLIAQRRAARYVDTVICEKLGLTTS